MVRDNLKAVIIASLLQIPADLLLDCRCSYYKISDEYMISWQYSWNYDLSRYNKDLEKSPYFIKQKRDHVSVDTIFRKPLID